MGLTEMQEAIARLLLDDSLRSDPRGLANQMPNLSHEEMKIINSIPIEDLASAAMVLPKKRLKRLEYLFPDTSSLLRENFRNAFNVFAAEILPRDEMQEASDFATTLAAMSKLGHISRFAGDIARFELLLLELREKSNPDEMRPTHDPWKPQLSRLCRLLKCNTDLPIVIKCLNAETDIPDSAYKPKNYLIRQKDGKVDLYEITDAQLKIIESCDGSTSVDDLTMRVVESTGLSKSRISEWFIELKKKEMLV